VPGTGTMRGRGYRDGCTNLRRDLCTQPAACLRIYRDPQQLRRFSLSNLNDYWSRWPHQPVISRTMPRRAAANAVLGAARLHYTITTGEIVTKEAAGRYSLDAFGRRWQALIDDALGFRRGSPSQPSYHHQPRRRLGDTSRFLAAVIDSADQLPIE